MVALHEYDDDVTAPVPSDAPLADVDDLKPFGLGWRWQWRTGRTWLRMTFRSMRKGTSGPSAEVTVDAGIPSIGVKGTLTVERLSLGDGNGRVKLANRLSKRTGEGETAPVDWRSMIDGICSRILVAQQAGPEVREIGLVEETAANWLIEGLVERHQTTSIYADGETGKSWLSLAACVSYMTGVEIVPGWKPSGRGRSLYIDYETDWETMNARVRMICRGAGIPYVPIGYVAYDGPLIDQLEWLLEKVHDEDIGLIVVDSVEAAMAGSRSDGGDMNDTASKMNQVLRKVGRSALLVDHVNSQNAASKGLAGKAYGCYSEDTEILTRSGWKRHADWSTGEPVACFDPEDGHLRWDVPSVLHVYDHDGEMIHLRSRSVDALVTPNHRMVVRPSWTKAAPARRERWDLIEADRLSRAQYQTPYSAPFENGIEDASGVSVAGRTFPADDFLRFLGWWVSEGCHQKHGALALTQAEGPLAAEMTDCLARLGIDHRWTVRTNPSRPHEKPCRYIFTRQTSALAAWLEEQGGQGAAGKRLPDFVWWLSPRQQAIVLGALLDGDGSRKANGAATYHTVSRRLADEVQQLAIMLGRGARISRVERSGQREHWQDAYIVYISTADRQTIRFNPAKNFERVPYTGKVYCFTVPTGAYLTRRYGKITVQGNSIFKRNWVRMSYEIKRVHEGGNGDKHLGVYCTKRNNGPRFDAFGLRWTINDELASWQREEITEPTLTAALPVKRRIEIALNEDSPLSVTTLAEVCEAPIGTIRVELSRDKGKTFRKTSNDLWELAPRLTIVNGAETPEELPWP